MAAGCVPTGETTHYDLCVAPLLQIMFAVHRFAQGTTAALPLRVAVAAAPQFLKSALRDCLPALIVILSRRRRISVQGTYELIDSKYQSAGKAKYQAPA